MVSDVFTVWHHINQLNTNILASFQINSYKIYTTLKSTSFYVILIKYNFIR